MGKFIKLLIILAAVTGLFMYYPQYSRLRNRPAAGAAGSNNADAGKGKLCQRISADRKHADDNFALSAGA